MATTITETQAAELQAGDIFDTRCGIADYAWAQITHVEHFTLPGGGNRVEITYRYLLGPLNEHTTSRIALPGTAVRVKTESPEEEAPVHAEELDEQGRGTGHALCGQDGPLANSSWQVTCEKCLTWHDEPGAPSASEFARSVCPPRDHQRALPHRATGKPGTAIQRAIAAYRNRAVLTVDAFMKSIGADDDTIRRYRGSLGRKIAQAWRAATDSEPVQSGWAVAHHRLIPVYAYQREDAEILRQTAVSYPKTSHLIKIGA